VASWKRTARRLDAWQIPGSRVTTWIPLSLKTAALVFLTLSIGVALGRTYLSPPRETAALKAQIQELAATAEQIQEALNRRLDESVDRTLAAVTAADEAQHRDLMEALHQAREIDQQATRTLIRQLRDETAAAYLFLRNDLETVAAQADTELRRAQRGLLQLAAYRTPAPEPSEETQP